jgi:hypothetical protein
MDIFEQLAETLPALQRSISVLHEKECMSLGIPCTEVQCVIDATLETPVRIEPGSCPIIRISATWAFHNVISHNSDIIVHALRRALRIAHGKLRWTLSNSKPRFAAEYIQKARSFRLCNPETFTLPVQSFRTRLTVTMTDAMTGEVETREHVRVAELQDVQAEMAHILTARVYAHEQVADLLDMLQAHKMAAAEPSELESVDLLQVTQTHTIETYNYADAK